MPKRGNAGGSGKPATAAQKAAGRANLAKGRAAKKKQMEDAAAMGIPTAGTRWSQLLDGTLSVKDLDDDEIDKMRVRGADGGFGGRRQKMPSHLVQAFHQEALHRATDEIRMAVPGAARKLVEMLEDSEAKPADILKAITLIMDRGLGKVPETVRIQGESAFDQMLDGSVDLDREMADLDREDG